MFSTTYLKDFITIIIYFQKLPLAATLILPSLVISKEIVDLRYLLGGTTKRDAIYAGKSFCIGQLLDGHNW